MESKLEFPPSAILTPYNYFEWKPKIQLHLRSRGLFRITMETEVEPTSAVEKSRYFNRMDEAFGILCFSISPELLFYVESCSTPNQVWKILEELFGKQNEMLKMVEDSIAIYRNSRENFSLEPEDPHVARLYATNYVQGLQETDDGDPNQSEGTIRGTSCANVACTGNEPKKDNVAAMAASLATGSGQAQAMNPALTSMGSLNSPLQTLNPPLNPGLSSALNPAQSKPLLGAAPPLHHSGPFPAFYDQHPQPPPQHSQRLYSQSRSDYEPVTRSFKGLSGPLPSDVAAELYNVLNNLTRTKESIKGVKTWFLLLFTSVPIGLLWLNVEGVLVHLGQDTAISKVAGTYLLFLLPDLVATSLLEPLRIYLRSQCITKPMMTCSAIAVALHVPINIFLRRLGVKGAALAICWSDFNVVLLLVGYVVKTGLHKTTHEEGWWRLKGCSGCVALLRLSVASCLMTCLEWWCYEIVMLITGRLPRPQESVSELAIMFNADQILFALMLSLGSCASTRVSNELGGNRPVGAYQAAVVSLGLSVVIACAGSVAMISGRNAWGGLFSRSEEVVRGVGKLLCVMGVMEIFNFPQAVSGGVLRGTGRPSMAVYANLGAFYLLGLPLGTVLAFKFKMGLMGLMVGLLVAISVCATLTVTAVLRMDWVQQALIAQNLTSQSLQLQPLAFDDDEEKDFDGVDRK